jgi:hypothetical protein
MIELRKYKKMHYIYVSTILTHVAHCFVVPSPLNALLSVKPQLKVNTIIPNTVQITAGSLAREYQGPFVRTKYADAGNYHELLH